MTQAFGNTLSDLAQAGFAMTVTPSMQVDFSVHHVADQPGYLLRLLRRGTGGRANGTAPARFVETLSSSANGLGIVVGTATGQASPGSPPVEETVRSPDDRRTIRNVFGGLARPNPTFLYESLDTFEALVAMERSYPAPMTARRARETRDLLARITSLAANEVGAPLLSVQCPVQVPPRVRGTPSVRDRTEPVPPPSASHGVRFSIPLARPDSRTRIALATGIADHCADRGYGLWVADTRVGHRAGNWFQIVPLPRVDEHEPEPDDDAPVLTCLPVTFVGPARIGSSDSIIDYLGRFPDLGIAACTMSTLDDLAFVHLQLVPGDRARDPDDEVTATLDALAARTDPAAPSLDQVLAELGLEREPTVGLEIAPRARDYQVLVGSAFAVSPPSTRRRMAVWFSWQAAAGDDALAGPLEALYRAAERIGLGVLPDRGRPPAELPSIEYLICRRTGGSVRGKGKVSLPKDVVDKNFAARGVEAAASRLSAQWETAWKAELARRPALGCSESTVAWREWWLGHWTSSL